jgi:hypothetical protein
MNALDPEHMTAAERLDELGELLAAGLMRLHARKSSQLSRDCEESSLAIPGHQSNPEKPVVWEGGAA